MFSNIIVCFKHSMFNYHKILNESKKNTRYTRLYAKTNNVISKYSVFLFANRFSYVSVEKTKRII